MSMSSDSVHLLSSSRKYFTPPKEKFSGDGDFGKLTEWDRGMRTALKDFNPSEHDVYMDTAAREVGFRSGHN